jgi:hypothetical protein
LTVTRCGDLLILAVEHLLGHFHGGCAWAFRISPTAINRSHPMRNLSIALLVCIVSYCSFNPTAAQANQPYVPVPGNPNWIFQLGQGIVTPGQVFGKEYSHDRDHDLNSTLSPEQVAAWDGSGGTANGLNYVGTRPTFTTLSEVDAIAHHADALFVPLKQDEAHLIYSIDNTGHTFFPQPGGPGFHQNVTVPSSGPIVLPSNVIGGAAEISYELATQGAALGNAFNTHGLWASRPQINASPIPDDIDGIEVWGPEPGFAADSDKYSLDPDSFSFGVVPNDAISVWNLSGTPYVLHSRIAQAVQSLLGPAPSEREINIDALMVRDIIGDENVFERDVANNTDEIIFSIRQILDPTDPSGFYATGSELFVLEAPFAVGAPGLASFLNHGGHFWDKPYALANMTTLLTIILDQEQFEVTVQLDIDGIEAVPEAAVVPEPSSALLLLIGMAALARRRRFAA